MPNKESILVIYLIGMNMAMMVEFPSRPQREQYNRKEMECQINRPINATTKMGN